MLSRKALVVGLSSFIGFALAPTAHARDMQGRFGLGYNAQFANSQATNAVPGVSIKYGLTRDIGTSIVVGTTTRSPSNSVAALKLTKNLFYETNLNFYFMVAGGIVSGGGNSGAEFQGGFGAEFFIPGLESLGFAMETGASLNSLGGSFALQTIGVSFLNAGMHFYF